MYCGSNICEASTTFQRDGVAHKGAVERTRFAQVLCRPSRTSIKAWGTRAMRVMSASHHCRHDSLTSRRGLANGIVLVVVVLLQQLPPHANPIIFVQRHRLAFT